MYDLKNLANEQMNHKLMRLQINVYSWIMTKYDAVSRLIKLNLPFCSINNNIKSYSSDWSLDIFNENTIFIHLMNLSNET